MTGDITVQHGNTNRALGSTELFLLLLLIYLLATSLFLILLLLEFVSGGTNVWNVILWIISILLFMSIYHDEVEIEDMEYADEDEMYYYPCPCGDKFQISKVRTIRKHFVMISVCFLFTTRGSYNTRGATDTEPNPSPNPNSNATDPSPACHPASRFVWPSTRNYRHRWQVSNTSVSALFFLFFFLYCQQRTRLLQEYNLSSVESRTSS